MDSTSWDGLLTDSSPLLDVGRYASTAGEPLVGAAAVRDTDVPAVEGDGPPLAVLVSGGAGQIAGPAALCARRGLPLTSLTVALRDPADLAANARRVAVAVDDARAADALPDGVRVRVGLPAEPVSAGWLAAADEVAAAELDAGLSVAAGVPAAAVAGWIDALLDRETAFAATTDAGADRVVALLAATSAAWDGASPDEVAAVLSGATTAGGTPGPDGARRWCRSVVVPDAVRVAADLRRHLG